MATIVAMNHATDNTANTANMMFFKTAQGKKLSS